MTTHKVNKDGLTRGQAIAVTGIAAISGYMIKPFAKEFVNNLLWDGADAEFGEHSPVNPQSITGFIVSGVVRAVCKKSATVVVKHGPELISEWGGEIMRNGGKALSHMHDTIADAGSSVLAFAKDAIGLNSDTAMEVATSVVTVGSDTAMDAAADAAAAASAAVSDSVLDKAARFLENMFG